MTTTITPEQFLASDGVDDWRVLGTTAYTLYRTSSFSAGAGFIAAIAEVADELDHHPDIDLRYPSVTIRLTTHDAGGLTERDVRLAKRISALASEHGFEADPSAA